jgi:YggT family protein
MAMDFIYRATEPVLNKIRRYLPSLGSLDLAPIILIFVLIFVKDFLIQILLKFI